MAEGDQFRVSRSLALSEPGVEVLGFLVVICVDAHLVGVGSCVDFSEPPPPEGGLDLVINRQGAI